jgi:hypothetical protein
MKEAKNFLFGEFQLFCQLPYTHAGAYNRAARSKPFSAASK